MHPWLLQSWENWASQHTLHVPTYVSPSLLPGQQPPVFKLLPKAVPSMEQTQEEWDLCPLQQQCELNTALGQPLSMCPPRETLGQLHSLEKGLQQILSCKTSRYITEIWHFPPTAIVVSQGHHTSASICHSLDDEWKTEFRIWMVGVGWSHCTTGKNVGSVEVVDYL